MSDDTLPLRAELEDRLAREKHCLAAAELELSELITLKVRLEEQIAYTERAVKDGVSKVDKAWTAVRRRIDAETDSPLDAEVVKQRCARLLGPSNTSQFMNQA